MAVFLPTYYRARLGGYVVIETETDKPYVYFDKHKKQFPPDTRPLFERGRGNIYWISLQVLVSVPIPSISMHTSSPSFRYTEGSLNAPTPLGVPVKITSPG